MHRSVHLVLALALFVIWSGGAAAWAAQRAQAENCCTSACPARHASDSTRCCKVSAPDSQEVAPQSGRHYDAGVPVSLGPNTLSLPAQRSHCEPIFRALSPPGNCLAMLCSLQL